MKKKFLAACFIAMIVSTVSFAQGFHLGIKGGANLSKVDGKSFSEEFQYGYNAGLFSEIYFSKKWGIQPEVLWNQYNTQTTTEFKDVYNPSLSELTDVKLNYLSLPILLNYRPAKFLTFQVGPQFGILINKDQNLLQNGKEAFSQGDFSILGGAQLNIGGIKAGARYSIGLNNINDIDEQDKWRNQGWQLFIGFRII